MFCPAVIQTHTSVYSSFCAVNAVYTAHAAKQRTGRYSGVSGYLPYFAAVVWRVCKAILHRMSCAVLYHSAAAPPACTRYKHSAGRCHQYRPGAPAEVSASPPVQGHPSGVSMLPAPGGRRSGAGSAFMAHRRHPQPGGAVRQQGRGGRRGTIGGLRRISFRAFAR